MNQKNELKDKRIVISGAGGFIGSHLVESLLAEKAKVTALVHYNGLGNIGNLQFIKNITKNKNCKIVFGDITDTYFCLDLLKNQDIVIHLAMLIDVGYSFSVPKKYFEVNTIGTINLLDAAIRQKPKRFVHISSSETYGTAQYLPMDEKHPLFAQSPYAASKTGADQAVLSYGRSYNLAYTIIRPFNTFGPRQSLRAVIPNMIAQMLFAQKNSVRVGSLNASRDFTYIRDTIDAFLRIIQSTHTMNEIINVGSGKNYTLSQIHALLEKLMKTKKKLILDAKIARPKRSDIEKQICDNRFIHRLVDWQPKIKFEDGLSDTITWITDHPSFYSQSF